jgi:hypothetical protein
MATCYNCNKCKSAPCGCEDKGLTTPPACAQNTVDCPNPEPCAETFSDCCIIHNNDAFVYITEEDELTFSILQGERLCDTLQRLTAALFGGCGVSATYVYGLKSTAITSSSINVVWTPVLLADTYTVYYATVAGMSWSNSGPITASTSPTYTITGLTPNTPYYVYVTATIDGKQSCRSVSLIITTLN